MVIEHSALEIYRVLIDERKGKVETDENKIKER